MTQDLSNTKTKETQIFSDVKLHTDIGFRDTDSRATGRGRIGTISFNEADEMFRSWIDQAKWPYDALIFDPRIFTFIFEKTSRLIANKPKGRLSPRNGGDTLSAKINNALLDYQWDACTRGGSMVYKWSLMDINTRKYGAAFALTPWRYEEDPTGRVLYDGPDMEVLKNRDCAHDLTATSIESCNWFQVRSYPTIQELERVNDAARTGPIYKNLKKLRDALKTGGSANDGGGEGRSQNWQSRNRSITGIEEDPYGKDPSFKTVEIVTEYRKDRWITIAPRHGVVLRDIPNPYGNNEIPIVMLRYYAIDDDLYGMSEIEPVKGIQKAVNALISQYFDEINIKLKTPIAIGPGVRQHTLGWGKNARWIMNNPMTDFRLVESRSNAASFFNQTYSVLINAMMGALGESSLGISNVQPYQTDKTATEVKALQLQRNSRDNYNQIFLAEAIKRQYMLWHSMNQKLIFSDPKTTHYAIRLSGTDALDYFKMKGLHEYDLDDDLIAQEVDYEIENGEGTGLNMEEMKIPRYPVITDKKTNETTTKMVIDDDIKNDALLYIEPSDLKGEFEFQINVESMQLTADEERKQARKSAVDTLGTNPNIHQMLAQEGYRPKFKELYVTWLEDSGFSDAQRYFEKIDEPSESSAPAPAPTPQGSGSSAVPSGIPGGTNPNIGGEASQQSPFTPTNNGLGPVSPNALEQLQQNAQ